MRQGDEVCTGLQAASPVCCPSDSAPAQISESGGSSSPCPFCPSGVSADKASEAPPQAAGATCTDLTFYAASLGDGSTDCSDLQFLEPFCCPTEDEGEVEEATENTATDIENTAIDESGEPTFESEVAGESTTDSADACAFCPEGVSPDAADAEVPDSGGFTCSDLAAFAQNLSPGGDCDALVLATPLCCPDAAATSVQNYFEGMGTDGN